MLREMFHITVLMSVYLSIYALVLLLLISLILYAGISPYFLILACLPLGGLPLLYAKWSEDIHQYIDDQIEHVKDYVQDYFIARRQRKELNL